MARVKNGDHFSVTSQKDLEELVRRVQEDAQNENEYTTNNFPSDEEKKLMGSATGKTLRDLEGFLFRKNDLNILKK